MQTWRQTWSTGPASLYLSVRGLGKGFGGVRALDAVSLAVTGGELVAIRQNLETSSQDALKQRGNRARLQWRPGHTFDLTQRRDSNDGN